MQLRRSAAVNGGIDEFPEDFGSTLNDEMRQVVPATDRRPGLFFCGLSLLALIGSLGFYRELVTLWTIWMGDPLRSIGLLIPPVSVWLALRAWKQSQWELRGSWWGLLSIALAFMISALRQNVMVIGHIGATAWSFLPTSLPLYLYASGLVILFAGWRIWRRAWFPLLLFLLAQPIPAIINMGPIDLYLQAAAARSTRTFATMIGFIPTTPALRLMFTPDFGMFIAPGCDGSRGAITLAYIALVLGYIKRVSTVRWTLYVIGAGSLGYTFNFLRLWLLVVYYRLAVGHARLERVAKQADYAIGSCLFLVAVFLFLWMARRGSRTLEAVPPRAVVATLRSGGIRSLKWRGAALAVLATLVISLQANELEARLKNDRPKQSPDWMPKQVGDFSLSRTWYEQSGGIPVMDDAAYEVPGADEVLLGIWISPQHMHNANGCWLLRGFGTAERSMRYFTTAGGRSIAFDTGLYSDGITDTLIATAFCTSKTCTAYPDSPLGKPFAVQMIRVDPQKLIDEEHPISFLIRIDTPSTDTPRPIVYQRLYGEAQKFVSGLDVARLSRMYQ